MIKLKSISFLKKNKIAHRGIHEKYQENTLLSIKEAIKRNYTVELDVRMTKDQQLIIYHDDTLKRIYNTNKKISQLTKKDLKNYPDIPYLKDVLTFISGSVPILLEIKWDSRIKILIKKLVEELSDYPYPYAMMSFYLVPLYLLRKENKTYPLGLLLNRFLPNYFPLHFFLKFNPFHLDFLAVDLNLLKDNFILKLRKKYLILGYTINTYQEYYLYQKYADNFIWDAFKS